MSEQTWVVPHSLDGERIDRAIALITELSRREVNDVIDSGRVSVGSRVVSSRSRRVRAGERLHVEGAIEPAAAADIEADPGVEVPVVYQDSAVIVVDKPAGLVVHPGAGQRQHTLVNGLLAAFPDLAPMALDDGQEDRPGIVHRLDKGTSGLLVVARTRNARQSLIDQLSGRRVVRGYITLVSGHVDADRGLVDGPIGRSDADATRMRVQAGGRPARTRYQVRARFDHPAPLTLLECHLETGRTHQIRVHLGSIGHPVVGDDRYGVTSIDGWRPLPAGRPFLHAADLEFEHPETAQDMRFSSQLPQDLQNVLVTIDPRQP